MKKRFWLLPVVFAAIFIFTFLIHLETSKAATTKTTIYSSHLTSRVSVSLNVGSAINLYTGRTVSLTARVSGASNTSVTWTVDGISRGNSSVGTVTGTGNTVTYTAPLSSGSHTVKAISVQDTSKYAATAVYAVSLSSITSVTLSPSTATVNTGAQTQFSATVVGTGSFNNAVTWSATGGTVSSAGLYTAPTAAGTYTVTAKSTQDTTKVGTASVSVNANGTIPAGALNVMNYGAKGNGTADDTAAIQSAINAVASGGTVYVPAGTYMINALANSSSYGLTLKSNMTLTLASGATLKAMPNSAGSYVIVLVSASNNVTINGSGTIQGERANHSGTSGEWGMGIQISGSSQTVHVDGIILRDCWGDGIYVANASSVTINNITSDNNRRQGLSVVSGDTVYVTNSIFKNTNGTLPTAGIDLEPNSGSTVNNIHVVGNTITGNIGGGVIGGGAGITTNIYIDSNTITGNGGGGYIFGGVYFNDGTNGLQVTNNTVTSNIAFGIGLSTTVLKGVISGNTVSGTTAYNSTSGQNGTGLLLFGCDGATVSNNKISSNAGQGIYNGSTVTFSGNYVWNNGKASSPASLDTSAPSTTTPTITSVTVTPSTTSINTGAQTQFSAAVVGTGSFNNAVTWSATGGTVSSAGLYTAPTTAGTYTVTAKSTQDATKMGTGSVAVSVMSGPVVSNVVVSAITTTGVTISWSLNEYGTGQLSYGTTSAYGSLSTPENSLSYNAHVQTLTGLTPGTLYHFSIRSCDGVNFTGNCSTSTDYTFTTVSSSSSVASITSVTVTPTTATVTAGAQTQFSAAVVGTGSFNNAVTWSATRGTITASQAIGLYTAPSTAGSDTVTVRSSQDTTKSASAAITVAAVSSASSAGVGTGNSYSPLYVTGVGAGTMPSIASAPNADSCNNLSDATSCLQTAINSAASSGKPLVINSGTYHTQNPLNVVTSLIGVDTGNGQPKILFDDKNGNDQYTCSQGTSNGYHCDVLQLRAGATGLWIYNLYVQKPTIQGAEYPEIIGLGHVSNITIKGNYLKGASNSIEDGQISNESGSGAAQNILVDGNTMDSPYRCAIALTNWAQHWAVVNNFMNCPSGSCYVSPVDDEPSDTSHGSYPVSYIEYGYNKIYSPGHTSGGSPGVIAFDAASFTNPGRYAYAHHNYGGPWGDTFLYVSNSSWTSTGAVDKGNNTAQATCPSCQ